MGIKWTKQWEKPSAAPKIKTSVFLKWPNAHLISASDIPICTKKGCRVRGLRASLRNYEDAYPTLLTNQAQNSWMIPGITTAYRYVK